MARRRLTARDRVAADDKTPYPGSINQEGRAEEGRGSMTYRTFEPSAENHEGIDYGNVHGGDRHNEMGYGIPDPASGTLITGSEYQQKCLKAAELAELVLGEKVNDRMILAQARDFLALSSESLDAAIERFNRTETLYAAEEPKKEEPKKEEPKEEPKACAAAAEAPIKVETPKEEPKACVDAPKVEAPKAAAEEPKKDEKPVEPPKPACAAVEEPKKEEPKKEEPKMASKARALNIARLAARTLAHNQCTRENIVAQSAKFASLSDEQIGLALLACGEQPVVEGTQQLVTPGTVQAPAATTVQAPPAAPAPAPVASDFDAEITVAANTGIDIAGFDFNTSLMDAPLAANASADAELASLYNDPMYDQPFMASAGVPQQNAILAATQTLAGETPNVKVAAMKIGVQSLGSTVPAPAQPQPVASQDGSLEVLWRDAPDVNGFFA
jgi:hypothetical protein